VVRARVERERDSLWLNIQLDSEREQQRALSRGDARGRCALHYAAAEGHPLAALLAAGAGDLRGCGGEGGRGGGRTARLARPKAVSAVRKGRRATGFGRTQPRVTGTAAFGAGGVVESLPVQRLVDAPAALAAAAARLLAGRRLLLDSPDGRGNTALHYAAAAGQAGAVRELLGIGAGRGVVNGRGQAALEVARGAEVRAALTAPVGAPASATVAATAKYAGAAEGAAEGAGAGVGAGAATGGWVGGGTVQFTGTGTFGSVGSFGAIDSHSGGGAFTATATATASATVGATAAIAATATTAAATSLGMLLRRACADADLLQVERLLDTGASPSR
jgi:hypothetical protein